MCSAVWHEEKADEGSVDEGSIDEVSIDEGSNASHDVASTACANPTPAP